MPGRTPLREIAFIVMRETPFITVSATLLGLLGLFFFPSVLIGNDQEKSDQQGNEALEKGDYDKAIAAYDKAIRLNPRDTLAYNNRGMAYERKGDRGKAISDYSEAIRIDPKYETAYNNRGSAYGAKGDYDKAIADLNEAIRLDPKDPPPYVNRGIAYRRKGDFGKAIADLNEAIRLDPKNANAYDMRSNTYLCTEDYGKAISDANEAIHFNPRDRGAYDNRALAHSRKGNYSKALADSKEAMRLDPKNPRAYNAIAWILATCPQPAFRDGKKAVEYATKACELSAWKEPHSIDTLAAACAEAGDFEHAIRWEKQFLQTATLSEKDMTNAKTRLALYQAHGPYRADK